MSERDKNLNIEVFAKFQSKNPKYMILIVTNAYRMIIDNLDIRFVIVKKGNI